MPKNIRILILLLVLLVVAANSFYDKNQNWQQPTYIYLFAINVDNDPLVEEYIQSLTEKDFQQISTYIQNEAKKYEQPVYVYYTLGGRVKQLPPTVPRDGGVFDAIIWSLQFRYYHFKNKPDTPFRPDLSLYLKYHSPNKKILTETSTVLQNGRIGVINVFGSHDKTKNNNVVIAHESLHGFGASDKYDLKTGMPIYPYGYANIYQNPLLPQKQAELMAMHIPMTQEKFVMARDLTQTTIGEITALEIGWIKP